MYLKHSKNTIKSIVVDLFTKTPNYLSLQSCFHSNPSLFLKQTIYSKTLLSKNHFQLNKNHNYLLSLFNVKKSFQKVLKRYENVRNCYFLFFKQEDEVLHYILEFFIVKNFLHLEKFLQNYTKLLSFNFEKKFTNKNGSNFIQNNFSSFKKTILEVDFQEQLISFTLQFYSNSISKNVKPLSKNVKKRSWKNYFIDSYLFEYLSLYNSVTKYSYFCFFQNSLKNVTDQFQSFKQYFFVYIFVNFIAKSLKSKNLLNFSQNLETTKINPFSNFFYSYLSKNFFRNCFNFSFQTLKDEFPMSFHFEPFFLNFLLNFPTEFFIKNRLKSNFKIPLENFRENFYYLKKLNLMLDLSLFGPNSKNLLFNDQEQLLFVEKKFYIRNNFVNPFVNFLNSNSTLKSNSLILLTQVLTSSLKIFGNLKITKFKELLRALKNQNFQTTSYVKPHIFELLQKIRLVCFFSLKRRTLFFQKQLNFKNFKTRFLSNLCLLLANFKTTPIVNCQKNHIVKIFFQIFKQFQFKSKKLRWYEISVNFFNKTFVKEVKAKKPIVLFIFALQSFLFCIKSISFSKNLEKQLNEFLEYVLINYYLKISFLKMKKSILFEEMLRMHIKYQFLTTNELNSVPSFLKYKKLNAESSIFLSKTKISSFFYKTSLINFKKLEAYIFNDFSDFSISKNLSSYIKDLKNLIKTSSTETQINLIRKLNLKIYSISYYLNLLNLSYFSIFLDEKLFQLLWHWGARRHSNKSKKWIKSKYFHKFGRNNWIFGAFLDGNFEFSKSYSANFMYLPFHFQIEQQLKKKRK